MLFHFRFCRILIVSIFNCLNFRLCLFSIVSILDCVYSQLWLFPVLDTYSGQNIATLYSIKQIPTQENGTLPTTRPYCLNRCKGYCFATGKLMSRFVQVRVILVQTQSIRGPSIVQGICSLWLLSVPLKQTFELVLMLLWFVCWQAIVRATKSGNLNLKKCFKN